MMAARMPAKTRPASASGVKARRKRGAASSGLTSWASLPWATSAGTASPTPSQISRQRIWVPPSASGSQRSFRGSLSMKNLWSICGWPRVPTPKTKKKPSAVSPGLFRADRGTPGRSARAGDRRGDGAKTAAGPQGVDEDRQRRHHHQRALEEVGVDPRHHAARGRVEEHHQEAHRHHHRQAPGPQGWRVPNTASITRPRARSWAPSSRRCRRRSPRPTGPWWPGCRTAPGPRRGRCRSRAPRRAAAAAWRAPSRGGRGEAHRDVDEQRGDADPVGEPRAAQEDEAGKGRRHGGQRGDHESGALPGDEEVARVPGPVEGPDADAEHHRQIGEGGGGDERAVEEGQGSAPFSRGSGLGGQGRGAGSSSGGRRFVRVTSSLAGRVGERRAGGTPLGGFPAPCSLSCAAARGAGSPPPAPSPRPLPDPPSWVVVGSPSHRGVGSRRGDGCVGERGEDERG